MHSLGFRIWNEKLSLLFPQSIRIWHVSPGANCKQIHEWCFPASAIKSVTHDKRDARAAFLYVHENSDVFHLFFPNENIERR